MRVLVTGANGYIGRAVLAALSSAGHEPVALVRGDGADFPEGVESRVADLLDPVAIAASVREVEAVCHLAGLTRARESLEQPLRYFQVNVQGTLVLLDVMVKNGIDRLVFASTASIYGSPDRQPMSEILPDDPPHPYAATKQAAELAIDWLSRTGVMIATSLRLFNVVGGADPDSTRIMPRVVAAATDGLKFGVNGDGSAVRDYLHVDDAADAFVAALNRPVDSGSFRRYNIGSGSGASIMDVVAAAERATGHEINVVHGPPAAESQVLVCDPTRAAVELAWKAKRSGLDEIIRDVLRARASHG